MEDNVGLAIEWKHAFELNQCDVIICHNGVDAEMFLRSETFDLVITDLFVPNNKGGLYVLMTLLNMGEKAPPAIAVTGLLRSSYDTEDLSLFESRASRLGAALRFEKPIQAAELIIAAQNLWECEKNRTEF